MKKQIIAHTRSGLSNRLRLISSCLYLKERLDADLLVIWEKDEGLYADYEDIFQPNPHFTLLRNADKYKYIIRNKSLTKSKSILKKAVDVVNDKLAKSAGVDLVLFDEDIAKGYIDIERRASEVNTTYIYTCDEFYSYDKGIQTFIPTPKILKKLDEASSEFDENTVGMHIRRTDSVKSIELSPLNLYEDKMSELISQNINQKVYIATDDPSIENHFKNSYPENVIIYKKTFGRDTLEGIEDAVVELFLLSRTSRIFGSYYSSYSEMASKFGQIPLHVLKLTPHEL